MFARKIHVTILEPGRARDCPLGWLDQCLMRNFTGRAAFDDALPVDDGLLEVGFRVDLRALQDDLEDWLTRKHGQGKRVRLQLTEKQLSSPGLPQPR